jgi:hypothetical protein
MFYKNKLELFEVTVCAEFMHNHCVFDAFLCVNDA